jgi:hypothetical protein
MPGKNAVTAEPLLPRYRQDGWEVSMGAADSSALIMPTHRRCPPLAVRSGDHVATIDGENLGIVGEVAQHHFEVLSLPGDFWLSRDVVFLSDAQGVVVAFGLDDLWDHRLPRPEDSGAGPEHARVA